MSCDDQRNLFCNGYIHVLGLGAQAASFYQSVRSNIEEKNRNRQYQHGPDSWWLWSFSQIPSGLELNEHINQRAFEFADILFLLVDTGDETAVQNVERIGQCENSKNIDYPIIITFLLGDGEQDARERIASAVGCFVDLRDVQLEQYKKQETVEQIAYILISGIMEPFEGQQLVSMDLMDMQELFSHCGEIHFGVAHAVLGRPEDDVCMVAAKEATRELEAQCEIRLIRRAFLSIECGEPVSIYDLGEATQEIWASMDDDCDFLYNVSVSGDMKDHVQAVLFATEAPVTRQASPVTDPNGSLLWSWGSTMR